MRLNLIAGHEEEATVEEECYLHLFHITLKVLIILIASDDPHGSNHFTSILMYKKLMVMYRVPMMFTLMSMLSYMMMIWMYRVPMMLTLMYEMPKVYNDRGCQ